MLHRDQARRLANFCAQHNRRTFEIAQAFTEGFATDFPAVGSLMPLATKTQRFAFGRLAAMLAKNLGDLNTIQPRLSDLGARLRAAGFRPSHAAEARRAILAALSHHAGPAWSPLIEQDWSDAIDDVLARINVGPAAPLRIAA